MSAAPAFAQPSQPVAEQQSLPAVFRLDPAFDRIVAPDVRIEKLVTIAGVNGEGPIWRKDELWIADIPGGSVYAIKGDGSYRVVAREAGGRINPDLAMPARTRQGAVGMTHWRDGAVLVCGGAAREIGLLDRNGQRSSFLTSFEGKHLNSPNDLVVARDGALWFTDPAYSVPGYSPVPGSPVPPDKQMPFNGVFRFYKGQLQAMIRDLEVPNGLAFSRDGKTLYVANSAPEMFVRAYSVAADGSLSNPREFARFAEADRKGPGSPDGLKVDVQGHVWLAGPGGLHVFTPEGRLLGRIQFPVKAANMTFGEDGSTLFVTAGDTVYRLRTLVKGQAPLYAPR